MVSNVGVLERTSKDYRACFVETAWKNSPGLADREEFLFGKVACPAGGIDLIVVFGTDVMVEEVVEEIADDGDMVVDAFFGFDVKDLG